MSISVDREYESQIAGTLHDCLELKVLYFNGVQYSLRTIVEWFANKAGGAHYSKQMPEVFSSLIQTRTRSLGTLEQVLLQFAEAVIQIGVRLLNSVSDAEMYFAMALPRRLENDTVIVDAKHPNVPMRFSFGVRKSGKIWCRLVGIDMADFALEAPQLPEWHETHYVAFSASVEKDLRTRVAISFDGEVLFNHFFPSPLFLVSDWTDFNVLVNKSHEGGLQDCHFVFCEMITVGRELNAQERSKTLIHLSRWKNGEDLNALLFTPGSFAESKAGVKSLTMTGIVKSDQLRSLFSFKD